MRISAIDGYRPAGWDQRLPVLDANLRSLFDDAGIGKTVRSAPPLVVIPTADAPVLAAIGLIEGNPRAAPEVTLRESLFQASAIAGPSFSLRC